MRLDDKMRVPIALTRAQAERVELVRALERGGYLVVVNRPVTRPRRRMWEWVANAFSRRH